MNFPPVYHLLSDGCLESIADKIGKEWRQFFIHLGFKNADMDHWEHDSHKSLIDVIRTGLHKWKSNPLPPQKILNRNIKELLDWIIEALLRSKRQDIAEKLISEREQLDIDEVIDRLSLTLTNDSRMSCFINLGIKIEDIHRAQEDYNKLKDQTTTLLRDWLDEHLRKYWKYQEMLTVLRTMKENDIADQIIKECNVSDYTDKANGCSDTYRNENDSRTLNTSRKSQSDSLQNYKRTNGRKSQSDSRQINKRTNDNSRKVDEEPSATKKVKDEGQVIAVTGDDRGHNLVPVLDAFVETGKHVIDGTLRIFKAIINDKALKKKM